MGQSVFTKKDEKIADVVSQLSVGFTEDDFISQFQKQYPDDWEKIGKRYQKHLRKNKPGKKIPMPKPKKYMINALKSWQNKQNR